MESIHKYNLKTLFCDSLELDMLPKSVKVLLLDNLSRLQKSKAETMEPFDRAFRYYVHNFQHCVYNQPGIKFCLLVQVLAFSL